MTGYQRLLGYGIMKHAKEKGAAAQQAFPFLACFNEQIFLRSRKESSARADLLLQSQINFQAKINVLSKSSD